MRSLLSSFAVASLFLLPVAPAHAEMRRTSSSPLMMVRGYFEALGRNDFGRALSFTAGSAQARTLDMWQTLQEQAAANSAEVELKVRALRMAQRPSVGGTVPVDVTFDIDVVGHKWFFSRVARKIAGTAKFLVEPNGKSRIVAILGNLQWH